MNLTELINKKREEVAIFNLKKAEEVWVELKKELTVFLIKNKLECSNTQYCSTITFEDIELTLYNKENDEDGYLASLNYDVIQKAENYIEFICSFEDDFKYEIIEYFEKGKWLIYPVHQ